MDPPLSPRVGEKKNNTNKNKQNDNKPKRSNLRSAFPVSDPIDPTSPLCVASLESWHKPKMFPNFTRGPREGWDKWRYVVVVVLRLRAVFPMDLVIEVLKQPINYVPVPRPDFRYAIQHRMLIANWVAIKRDPDTERYQPAKKHQKGWCVALFVALRDHLPNDTITTLATSIKPFQLMHPVYGRYSNPPCTTCLVADGYGSLRLCAGCDPNRQDHYH